MLSFIIVRAIDILLISEIRIGFPFPTSMFVKNDNSNILKLALNNNGGEHMLLMKDSVTTFPFSRFCFLKDTSIFFTELHLIKQNPHNPPKRILKRLITAY